MQKEKLYSSTRLHGETTLSTFDTMSDTGNDYDMAMTNLDESFSPKKSIDYEIFRF